MIFRPKRLSSYQDSYAEGIRNGTIKPFKAKDELGTSTTSLVFYTDSAAQVDIKKDGFLKKLYKMSHTWKWDIIMFTLVSLGFIAELIKKILQLRKG